MKTAYSNRLWLLILIAVFYISLPIKTISQGRSVVDSLENVLKNSKEDTAKVNALNALSERFKLNNPDTAIYFANQAENLSIRLNYKMGNANACQNRGMALIVQGNYDKALKKINDAVESYDQLLALVDDVENKASKTRILKQKAKAINYIGMIYSYQGNISEAIKYYFAALKIKEEIGDKKGIAVSYNNIGNSYQEQGNYPEALKILLASLKIKEEIGDKSGIAYSYQNIGIIYGKQGNYPQALKNFSISLKIREEIGDRQGTSMSYSCLANIYNAQGNYPEALKNLLAALKINEGIGDKRTISIIYNNIGNLYETLGNYPEALRNHFDALHIREKIGDKNGIASSYQNIGINYKHQNNYPDALKCYSASLKIFEEIGDKQGIAASYHNIGVLLNDQGNSSEAIKNYLTSIKISEEIGDKQGIASSCQNIGTLYIKLKRNEEAREYLIKGLSLAKEIGNLLDIENSYFGLAELDSAEDNFQQSLDHYKLYSLYKDSLFNEKSNKQVSQMKIQFETEKKDKEIDLLNKENSIKALQMEQQKVSLLASKFELENNRNEILLLNKSNELQQLQLVKTQEDRDHQLLVVKAKTAGMELMKKEKELKVQQLKEQKLLRNGILTGTVLLLLLGLFLFRSLHLRKKLEKQKAIIQERKRISADLHDDIGSGLSKISLLSEMVKQQAKSTEARIEAEKIAKIARELLDSIREIIWALNANNDYLENLVAFIRKNAAEYFENSSIKLMIETPVKIPQKSISGEYRRNVFYSVKEAMHNIVKHSGATEAEVKFTIEDDVFSISIKDNGKGFPEGELNRFGNGIKNIMSRMETIHGNVTIENHVGTKITLALPV